MYTRASRLPYLLLGTLLGTFLGALLPGTAARAQGFIIPRPIRPVPAPQPLAVRSQRVTIRVQDGAQRVEVEQLYYNPNAVPMEGTYLFPLPESAVISSFRMQVDKEPLEGKVLNSDEARRLYESYVRRNVDPALLEYVGRNAFQARVFPIPAGAERRISLVYSQTPEFSGGVYRVMYPLNSERVTGGSLGDLAIDCSIRSTQAIRNVYSPSHEVLVKRDGERSARVTFEGKDVRPNRDFVLYYSTSDKEFGLNTLSYRRPGEDGYLMLMLAPKAEVSPAEIQPRDVVFVFDTSGSMQGVKIDQARQALRTMLGALNDRDRFNIIRFSSDVTSFRAGVVPASRENREAARAFVDDLKAIGGTAIDDALQQALASFPSPDQRSGHAPYLIFMTDGLPTVGVTDVDQILKSASRAAPADLRFFPFGVGADVNTLLLDRLARDNRGVAEYVVHDDDLEAKIGAFYSKISNPVLADVKVSVSGIELKDTYPNRLPDLFAGTQLLLLGRYRGQGKATVTLSGTLNGKPQRFTYDIAAPERDLSNDFLPKLWAGRRIGFLLEEIRLHGENPELKDEVVRLSKEHGIVTPYTSYLVEEAGLPAPVAGGVPILHGANQLGVGPGSGYAGAGGLGGFGGLGGSVGDSPAGGADRKAGAVEAGKKDAYGRRPAAPAGKPGPQGSRGPQGPLVPQGERGASGNTNNYAYREPSSQNQVTQNGQYGAQRYLQQAEGFRHTTGLNAVEASRRVQQLKDKTQSDTDVELSRTVEGRTFRLLSGVWTDQTIPSKPAVVPVRFGSDAYFRLVSAHATWARFLGLGRAVTFRTGKSSVVRVGPTGKSTLSDTELRALER